MTKELYWLAGVLGTLAVVAIVVNRGTGVDRVKPDAGARFTIDNAAKLRV